MTAVREGVLPYESSARRDWEKRNLRAAPARKPRPRPGVERYPGQVLNHTCGVSRNCEPCRIEKSFKEAVVVAVARIPRSPLRLVRLEYASDDDAFRYMGDGELGHRLELRARAGYSVGDRVIVRWVKKPRARRWRLEVQG